jgi:hypothetical protein
MVTWQYPRPHLPNYKDNHMLLHQNSEGGITKRKQQKTNKLINATKNQQHNRHNEKQTCLNQLENLRNMNPQWEDRFLLGFNSFIYITKYSA